MFQPIQRDSEYTPPLPCLYECREAEKSGHQQDDACSELTITTHKHIQSRTHSSSALECMFCCTAIVKQLQEIRKCSFPSVQLRPQLNFPPLHCWCPSGVSHKWLITSQTVPSMCQRQSPHSNLFLQVPQSTKLTASSHNRTRCKENLSNSRVSSSQENNPKHS